MFSESKKNVKTLKQEVPGIVNRIVANTKIKGDIISETDFRFDGELEGSLKVQQGKVVIGKSGYINGDIECLNADIVGKFCGELKVSELLTLKSTAIIEGKVIAKKLSVEPGASFNASCSMKGTLPPVKTIKKHAEG